MLKDIIQNFPKQLDYEPVIENADNFHKKDRFTPHLSLDSAPRDLAGGQSKKGAGFIVCGMGGSNLVAGIIESWKPKLDVIIHRDYGLPEMEDGSLKGYLVIASSYSGNTEETISSFQEASARKLDIVVLATGGKLLELAQENKVPYIQMPKIDGNPRFAIGTSIMATLKAMGQENVLNDVRGLAQSLDAQDYEESGKELAEKLKNKMPLIYSSGQHTGLARHWKVSFNETVKVPAFYNFLPELNHNEMIGFDSQIFDGPLRQSSSEASKLNHKFAFIFLNDPDDEPQIIKRANATKKLLEDRGYTILNIDLAGPSLWHKSFVSILTAMWTSYYLAEYYDVNPEDISMIEDFKKSLS